MCYTYIMNPKIFLRLGGSILITVGILGLIGLLGKISSASVFHPPYWINYFHLTLGIIIFALSFTKLKKLQIGFTLGATIVGTTIGLIGLLFGSYFANKYNIPELKDVSDHLTHLVVGLTAFWAWRNRKSSSWQ